MSINIGVVEVKNLPSSIHRTHRLGLYDSFFLVHAWHGGILFKLHFTHHT